MQEGKINNMTNQVEDIKLSKFIKNRRSSVSFSTRSVEEIKIQLLFEAARWAPSSYNEQPWRFIYGLKNGRGVYQTLFECLTEGNQEWVKNAPVLILSILKSNFSHNNLPNYYALHDVGLATENLMLQAVYMGLSAHPMGGFYKNKAVSELFIPIEFEPVAMIAVGYQGETGNLPEHLKKRELGERVRKPLSEFVFTGKWI